jgi:hypothetical protein
MEAVALEAQLNGRMHEQRRLVFPNSLKAGNGAAGPVTGTRVATRLESRTGLRTGAQEVGKCFATVDSMGGRW